MRREKIAKPQWLVLSGGGRIHRARSSPVIELTRLTALEAEHVVASLWCLLEEHGLASPSVAVRAGDGLLDIRLTFASPREAVFIANCPLRRRQA